MLTAAPAHGQEEGDGDEPGVMIVEVEADGEGGVMVFGAGGPQDGSPFTLRRAADPSLPFSAGELAIELDLPDDVVGRIARSVEGYHRALRPARDDDGDGDWQAFGGLRRPDPERVEAERTALIARVRDLLPEDARAGFDEILERKAEARRRHEEAIRKRAEEMRERMGAGGPQIRVVPAAGNGGPRLNGGDDGPAARGPGDWRMQRIRKALEDHGLDPEAWPVLEPLAREVLDVQREQATELGRARAVLTGAVGRAQGAEAVRAALADYRKAKETAEEAIRAARESLREVLSLEQEAALIAQGVLD